MSDIPRFRFLRRYLAPRWLTEGEGQLVGYALDIVKDAFVERLRQGHLARFPQNDANGTPSPTDALVALGRDRRVQRGINDTDTTYAARLRLWLDDRKTCGNPFTLMRQLAGYCGTLNGVSFRTVDNSGNWYARDAAGVETSSVKLANWNWDGSTAAWSRFWVIVYPGTLWAAETQTWGAGLYGDATGTLGCTLTPEHSAVIKSLVEEWKPAGTVGEIILALDPASFLPATPEPNGTWGKWFRYSAGVAIASRLATARYFGA